MAVIERNPWISGASGMVMDEVVYRQRAGKTILSAKPRKSLKPASEKQKQHRERFREASRYAKAAAKHGVKGALYAEQADGFNSAYNIALKDYLVAPVIHGFDLKGFRGRKGDRVGIYAEDNFRVAELRVWVLNAAGEVLTTGEAEEVMNNRYFSYRVLTGMPAGEGLTLRAEAKDHAGNVTVREEAIGCFERSRPTPVIRKMVNGFLMLAVLLLTACGGAGKPMTTVQGYAVSYMFTGEMYDEAQGAEVQTGLLLIRSTHTRFFIGTRKRDWCCKHEGDFVVWVGGRYFDTLTNKSRPPFGERPTLT
ncbi:hypothetical protein AB9P05_16355 [Roseivirga sp. BDSF3-8]|uniref:hypothetical protein n=1 Tax=Roseivirga sp. BDSF3-8 TaxID=3241598 RepID=UPI003531825F